MIERLELSWSRLKAYQDCPWQYKLLYIERKRPPISAQSSLGRSLHEALAAFYEARATTLDQLLDFYEDHWFHAGYSSPQEQAEFHAKGQKILERFFPMELERRSKVLFVERAFSFPLGPYFVRGIIDRVDERPDGSIEVLDYKSQLEPQAEAEVGRNIQLRIYGWAAREALHLEPAWLGILYLSSAKAVSVPYDPSGEAPLKAMLEGVAGRIASADFAPDTKHCPSCVLRKSCEYSVSPS